MMRKGLATAVVLAVALVAVFAYFVGRAALTTGDAQSMADAALRNAGTHTQDYDKELRITADAASLGSSSNSSPGFAQIKQAADALVARLDQVRVSIRADRARLGAAADQLDAAAQNPLAAPFRSNLDRSQGRVASAMSALAAADTALGIDRDEMRATSAFMDVMNGYTTLDGKEKAGDVSGGLALFTTLDPKVQAALQAAQGSDIPAHDAALVKAIAAVVADKRPSCRPLRLMTRTG